jgi:hypothetical protein
MSVATTTAMTERLSALRADLRIRAVAIVVGVVVAVGLGTFHWVGFVIGGAIAGLGQRDLLRGTGAGLLVGALAWLVFAALLAVNGTLDAALGMGRILFVSVAIPLVAGALGGLIRGII